MLKTLLNYVVFELALTTLFHQMKDSFPVSDDFCESMFEKVMEGGTALIPIERYDEFWAYIMRNEPNNAEIMIEHKDYGYTQCRCWLFRLDGEVVLRTPK